jgi:hemerythrin-like domain-containing protein
MGPIGCMLEEHEQGRAHVAAIRAALPAAADDPAAAQTVRQKALAYCGLLRDHISKENNVLFRWGDQLLTPQDKDDLYQKFQCSHHSPLPPGTHEKYTALATELRTLAGLSGASKPQCGTCAGACR